MPVWLGHPRHSAAMSASGRGPPPALSRRHAAARRDGCAVEHGQQGQAAAAGERAVAVAAVAAESRGRDPAQRHDQLAQQCHHGVEVGSRRHRVRAHADAPRGGRRPGARGGRGRQCARRRAAPDHLRVLRFQPRGAAARPAGQQDGGVRKGEDCAAGRVRLLQPVDGRTAAAGLAGGAASRRQGETCADSKAEYASPRRWLDSSHSILF